MLAIASAAIASPVSAFKLKIPAVNAGDHVNIVAVPATGCAIAR